MEVIEAQWLEKLQELADFKQNHGDTLVPDIYTANPSLGKYVGTQRTCYSNFQAMKEIEEKWIGVEDLFIEVLDDQVKKELERLNRLAADTNNTYVLSSLKQRISFETHSRFSGLKSWTNLKTIR